MLRKLTEKLNRYSWVWYGSALCIFMLVSVLLNLVHVPQLLLRIYWILGLTAGISVYLLKCDIEPISRCILFAAYVLRVIVILVNNYLNNIISSILGIGDDVVFANASVQFFRKTPDFTYPSRQFPKLMAALYHIFGEDPLIGVLVLTVLFMIGCFAFYWIMELSGVSLRFRQVGSAALCFAPYGIVFSVLFLREQINFCFLTLSFLLFVRHVQSDRIYELFSAMFLSLPVLWMHWGYIPVLAGYIVYFFLFYRAPKEKQTAFRLVKMAFLAVFIAGAYAMISHSGRIRYFIEAGNFLDGLKLTLEKYAGLGGDSMYLRDMTIDHPWQIVIYTPLRMLYFFLSPAPMDWRDWRDAISFILDSSLYLIGMAAYAWALCRKGKTPLTEHVAFWITAAVGAVFCWGTVTAGAAIRHRNCLLGFVLFISVSAFSRYRKKPETGYDTIMTCSEYEAEHKRESQC